GSSVLLINGASPCNVFWQVGSSATLGTSTNFAGNILALASSTATTNATVQGRLLARTGAVTLDTNKVDALICGAVMPTVSPLVIPSVSPSVTIPITVTRTITATVPVTATRTITATVPVTATRTITTTLAATVTPSTAPPSADGSPGLPPIWVVIGVAALVGGGWWAI